MLFRLAAAVTASLAAVNLGACTPPTADVPYDDGGEMIALSGGAAGARAACHACHGLQGEGGALVPRIAALDAGYIVRQLGFYAEGQRHHPQMSWLAGRLDPSHRAAVAAYYAAMPLPSGEVPANVPQPGCVNRRIAALYHRGAPARRLSSCASCHGEDGAGVGLGNPDLRHQPSPYLAKQLRDWREGRRYGDPLGLMHDAAARLRESEITPLADYIARGPGRSDRPGSPAICP